jgi:glutathione S-transferase
VSRSAINWGVSWFSILNWPDLLPLGSAVSIREVVTDDSQGVRGVEMITLYHGLASTCSKKVRMCLYEKGIQFESRLLNLQKFEQHQPEYLALNPNGVVPTLVHDGRVIIESSIIVEYLDDAFPTPPLRPFDPYWRAQVKLWLKFSDDVAYNAVYAPTWMILSSKAMSGFTDEERQRVIARIPQLERRKRWFSEAELQSAADKMLLCLKRCEQCLGSGDFLVNDEFSLADIAMIPFIDRITKLRPELFKNGHYPKLISWYDRMKSRGAFDHAFNFKDDPRATEMPNI